MRPTLSTCSPKCDGNSFATPDIMSSTGAWLCCCLSICLSDFTGNHSSSLSFTIMLVFGEHDDDDDGEGGVGDFVSKFVVAEFSRRMDFFFGALLVRCFLCDLIEDAVGGVFSFSLLREFFLLSILNFLSLYNNFCLKIYFLK